MNLKGQGLSYREVGGDGPAFLFLHGAGGSSLHYSELLRIVGRKRRAIALDLPGHGRSDPLPDGLDPDSLLWRYRDLVAEFAETLGLGRFVLVGHSMGGAVALHFACAYADRLHGLSLIATAARLRVDPSVIFAIENHFEGLAQILGAVAYSPAGDPQQVQRWAADQIQANQEVCLADFRACAGFDLRAELGVMDLPCLIVGGADDQLTPPKLQHRLLAYFPRANLQILDRCGHFPFRERAEAVAELLLTI